MRKLSRRIPRQRKPASIQPVGILDMRDIRFDTKRGLIAIGGKPVKKAIVLLYMPTCPHCQEPKRVFQTMDLRPYGAKKLAVNCARNDELAKRSPELFGFDENEYTVPKLFIIKNGVRVKQLPSIDQFHPQIEFQ